jgi:hypothetical protein
LHFRSICDSFSSFLYKGYLPLTTPFLIPTSFQIQSLKCAIAFLSFILQQDTCIYNSLPYSFFIMHLKISCLPFCVCCNLSLYILTSFYSLQHITLISQLFPFCHMYLSQILYKAPLLI